MTSTPDLTSVQIRRALDGERAGLEWVVSHFQSLVETHVRLRLGGRARPEDVQDLAQDVWMVVLPRLGDLEPRGGRFAPVLARFLGTTALRLCNNVLRKQIRRGDAAPHDHEGRPLEELAHATRGVVTRVAHGELGGAIHRCFERLPESKRQVLALRLLEQRGNQEIAEILGVPPNTVAVRYRRALRELRQCLPAEDFEELRATAP